MEEIVQKVLKGTENFQCGNDVEAGWAGSLACRPGINIVAGTGAIGFGRDKDGNSARASGWGYFMGDEGSGYWLGKKLISLFTKQADGREPKTPLYEIVRNTYNLEKDFDFIDVIYEDMEMKRDQVAKLALLLDKAIEQGDKKAEELFEKAAYEHSLTVKAIIDKLNLTKDDELLVSYSGGVFKAGKYILKPFKKYLQSGETKKVKLMEPVLKPVTGAALYSMMLAENKDIKENFDLILDQLKKEEKRREF